VCKLWIRVKL